MHRSRRSQLIAGGLLILLFIVFTVLVQRVDVAAIGPSGSEVGFSSLNALVQERLPYRENWYLLTKYIGYVPFLFLPFCLIVALVQLVKWRSLFEIDRCLYLLAFFDVLVLGIYVLFEKVIINYRPVILDEGLEASYPSSHTLMAIFILGTAFLVFPRYASYHASLLLRGLCIFLMAFIVLGRLVSGVHWFTDILASCLLGAGLVLLYGGLMPED